MLSLYPWSFSLTSLVFIFQDPDTNAPQAHVLYDEAHPIWGFSGPDGWKIWGETPGILGIVVASFFCCCLYGDHHPWMNLLEKRLSVELRHPLSVGDQRTERASSVSRPVPTERTEPSIHTLLWQSMNLSNNMLIRNNRKSVKRRSCRQVRGWGTLQNNSLILMSVKALILLIRKEK